VIKCDESRSFACKEFMKFGGMIHDKGIEGGTTIKVKDD